jgi:hypothetical protein
MLAIAKLAKWDEVAERTDFSRSMTPDEIMNTLEQRVGPKGRALFEKFLRDVNHLQLESEREEDADRGGESPPGSSSKLA